MAREPLEFRSVAEAVSALRTVAKPASLYFGNKDRFSTWIDLVIHSVAQNTFRGLSTKPSKSSPSEIYRGWAFNLPERGVVDQINSCKSQMEFNTCIDKLVLEIKEQWKEKTNGMKILSEGQARKLVVLLTKDMIRWKKVETDKRADLLGYFHVPLDNYALMILRSLQWQIPPISAWYDSIPKSASMSYVKDKKTFYDLQRAISFLTQKAEIPRIYFDYLSWYQQH